MKDKIRLMAYPAPTRTDCRGCALEFGQSSHWRKYAPADRIAPARCQKYCPGVGAILVPYPGRIRLRRVHASSCEKCFFFAAEHRICRKPTRVPDCGNAFVYVYDGRELA